MTRQETTDWLDAQFASMAAEAGAETMEAAEYIEHDVLSRAGYYEAFGQGATSVPGAASHETRRRTPAMCYHAYASLAGQPLSAPRRLTIVGTCHRDEPDAATPWRLSEFTMREIVFLGPSEWVASERRDWMARVEAFASSVGLDVTLAVATDPFFVGGGARGRRLMQQLKELKYELRVQGDESPVALASFNLHETFFGSRFNLTMAGGETVSSGCVAFGLERWTLALMRQGVKT